MNRHPSSEPALIDGGPLDGIAPSLAAMLDQGAERDPHAPALISAHQPGTHLAAVVSADPHHPDPTAAPDGSLQWSYAQVQRGAQRLAASLLARGVPRGATLLTLLPNSAAWSLSFWVAARLQLTLVPLDPGLAARGAREADLGFFLRLFAGGAPVVVAVADEAQARAVDAVAAGEGCAVVAARLCVAPTQLPGWIGLEVLAAAVPEPRDIPQDAAVERGGARLAAILFTSGTSTGRPKGCPLSSANLCAAFAYRPDFFGIRAGARVLLHTVNFRAVHVLGSAGTWRHGGCVVLGGEVFSARASLAAMAAHRCATALCVPAQVHALADAGPEAYDLAAFRALAVGGDIMTRELRDKARATFPGAVVRNSFGMTEGVGIVGWPPGTAMDDADAGGHVAGVGTALPGARIKICDGEKRVLRRGEIGELHLSAASMIAAYYQGEQPELFYADDDGRRWVVTGDRAMLDAKGYLYVLGRSKDVIKRSGNPLSPAMIEAFLEREFGVQVG